jgi:excisionase family DNA binding protein
VSNEAQWLTVLDVARRLDVGTGQITKGIVAGRIPATKWGRSWRIPATYLTELEQQARARTTQSAPASPSTKAAITDALQFAKRRSA